MKDFLIHIIKSVLNSICIIFFVTNTYGFDFGDIPIQDEGRIKPFDSFARNNLLAFYGKSELQNGVNATDWLFGLILDPEKGKEEKVFNISNPDVVASLYLEWTTEHRYSFNEIIPGLQDQIELIRSIDSKPKEDRTVFEKNLLILSQNAMRFEELSFLKGVKLIPPLSLSENQEWVSPFDFIVNGQPPQSHQQDILDVLQELLSSRLSANNGHKNTALNNYKIALNNLQFSEIDIENIKKENWLNRTDLFVKSLVFYILAFIVLLVSWMLKPNLLRKVAFMSLIIGFIIHGYAIILRMQIMNRPPVTTLYESVIFVSFIILLLAVVLEYFRKDGLGSFVGSISGVILHFIGFSYSADGDTLEVLVAVLDSNFWLATHVTTITMGYGASLVAGFVGHLYLIQNAFYPQRKEKLKSIFKNLFGITLVALFFTLFGTILGGIWADQSWGRFWGWDPKENGALLIVLWQLMMIHMRLSGLANPKQFALGMGLNTITVALAWFGVNLLQVGLHSYGFDDGVARNLYFFIFIEIVLCFGLYYYPKYRPFFARS